MTFSTIIIGHAFGPHTWYYIPPAPPQLHLEYKSWETQECLGCSAILDGTVQTAEDVGQMAF